MSAERISSFRFYSRENGDDGARRKKKAQNHWIKNEEKNANCWQHNKQSIIFIFVYRYIIIDVTWRWTNHFGTHNLLFKIYIDAVQRQRKRTKRTFLTSKSLNSTCIFSILTKRRFKLSMNVYIIFFYFFLCDFQRQINVQKPVNLPYQNVDDVSMLAYWSFNKMKSHKLRHDVIHFTLFRYILLFYLKDHFPWTDILNIEQRMLRWAAWQKRRHRSLLSIMIVELCFIDSWKHFALVCTESKSLICWQNVG